MTIADSLPPEIHHDASVLDVADGLARVMGDRALFARMLRRFAADYGAGVAPIVGALDSGDLRLAHRLAHTLKGAAGMISAHALHHHSGLLELALRKGDRATAAELDAVGVAFGALLPAIDRLLGGKAVQAVPASAALASDHLLVAQLAELLANGDGAAVDLLEQSGTGLAAALGHARFCEVALAANEFDFEGALEALRQGGGAGTAAAGG